jgi:hypothetical protein
MKFSLRCLALTVCAAGVMSGCYSRPPVVEAKRDGGVVRNAKTGMYTKAVMTKKEPDTFLAEDLTICRVPADRFRDTAVHSLVYCNWQ